MLEDSQQWIVTNWVRQTVPWTWIRNSEAAVTQCCAMCCQHDKIRWRQVHTMPWFIARDRTSGIFSGRLVCARVHIGVPVHTTCTGCSEAFTASEALRVVEWCGHRRNVIIQCSNFIFAGAKKVAVRPPILCNPYFSHNYFTVSCTKYWESSLCKTRNHPEMVGDMSRVTLNFDLSKIPFVHF